MAKKRNGSFPESVQPGIPKLYETPSGWTREPLGAHLCEVKRPVDMTDDAEYKLVTVKRSRGGAEERSVLTGRDIKVKSQFYVKPNDFLISKRQIVHGACALVPDELDQAIVSNEYAVLEAGDALDLDFLKYLSHSIYFQQTCFHSSIGVHVEKMIFKLDQWLKWEFNLPPIAEQKRISQILSTWDRAVGAMDGMIKNCLLEKKALMQQLLEGKRKFPSDNEIWRPVQLSEFIEEHRDKSKIQDEYEVLTSSREGLVRQNAYFRNRRLAEKNNIGFNILPPEYITYRSRSDDGVFRFNKNHLGITGIVSIYYPVFKVVGGVDEFLLGLLKLKERQVGSYSVGTSQTVLSMSALKKVKFKAPSQDNMIKIGKALRSADLRIQALKKKKELIEIEKYALMQQLISGERRTAHS
nr:restriction endonuclease subunit S [uncultured Pseudodesulfovibrio sp.]